MYNTPVLPNTGLAVALWVPLAAFALIFLGLALIRAARSFREDDDENTEDTPLETMLDSGD